MTPLNLKPTSSIVANSPGFTIELPAVCLRSRSANLSALTSLSESNSTNLLKQVLKMKTIEFQMSFSTVVFCAGTACTSSTLSSHPKRIQPDHYGSFDHEL